MKSVAVVQARMGSSRLPGKVLMPLVGQPVLWHIVHRLRKCAALDEFVIATSTEPTDDPIEEFCAEHGVRCVRGPEDDVLARFGIAAEATEAEIIIRITGDAPLIDPTLIDRWIVALRESGADVVVQLPRAPTIIEGIDSLSRSALDLLLREHADHPVAREHVTAYFKRHPEAARTTFIPADPAHFFRGARVSLDTPADFEFLERVHVELDAAAGEVDVSALVRLLEQQPELLEINGHIHQKAMDERSWRTVILCGDETDELEACLGLGDALRDRFGVGVTFASGPGAAGALRAARAAIPVEERPEQADGVRWLDELVRRLAPDALVIDGRSGLEQDDLAALCAVDRVIAVLDGCTPPPIDADLVLDLGSDPLDSARALVEAHDRRLRA